MNTAASLAGPNDERWLYQKLKVNHNISEEVSDHWSIEDLTGIAEVMGSTPARARIFSRLYYSLLLIK